MQINSPDKRPHQQQGGQNAARYGGSFESNSKITMGDNKPNNKKRGQPFTGKNPFGGLPNIGGSDNIPPNWVPPGEVASDSPEGRKKRKKRSGRGVRGESTDQKTNRNLDYTRDTIKKSNGGSPMGRRRNGSSGSGGSKFNSTRFTSDTPGSTTPGMMSWFVRENYSGGSPVLPGANIKSGLVFNTAQNTTDDFSPLYVQSGAVFPPYTVATTAANYFQEILFKDVYPEVYSKLRENLTRRPPEDEFNLSIWYGYTQAVAEALQLYYMYDSLRAFMSDPNNHNVAIRSIYDEISVTAWHEVDRMRATLYRQFIKPEMVQLICWMYQTYKPSEDNGTTLYKMGYFNYFNPAHPDWAMFRTGTKLVNLIDDLNAKVNLDMSALMNKALPNWRIENLPASSVYPQYDERFLTFWTNCGHSHSGVAGLSVEYDKKVSSQSENEDYYLVGDEIDGLILSLSSLALYDSGTQDYTILNGMWIPAPSYGGISTDLEKSSLLHWNLTKMESVKKISYLAN